MLFVLVPQFTVGTNTIINNMYLKNVLIDKNDLSKAINEKLNTSV